MEVRAFLAIDLPKDLKKKLHSLNQGDVQPEAQGFKIKWVEEENFHITLRFLGEVKTKVLKKMYKDLEEKLKGFPSFKLSLRDVGFFKRGEVPKVVWIGLSESQILPEVVHTINKTFKKYGFPLPKEDFHPHITLFRVKHISSIENFENYYEKINNLAKDLYNFSFLVREIVFFKSTLTSKGPKYEILYKIPLQKKEVL